MKKELPLGAKIEAIKKAIKSGQKFYVQTYVGKAEVVGMANDGHFAWAKGRSWAICSTHINCWYSEIFQLNKPGLKPGASLPTSARQSQIMVQMSIMAKAKLALEKLKITIYEIDFVPTTLKSTDGSTYISTASHIRFCDGTKKDKDDDVNEEKTVVYID